MVNLDIGCGNKPKGDINIDLYSGKTPHANQVINPKSIPNFIKAHAEYLPFQSKVFNIVKSYHLLEHLGNPLNALKEMKRVAQKKVIVVVPNAENVIGDYENPKHLIGWTPTSFKNLMNHIFDDIIVEPQSTKQIFKKGLPITMQFILNRFIWSFAFSKVTEIIGVGFCG